MKPRPQLVVGSPYWSEAGAPVVPIIFGTTTIWFALENRLVDVKRDPPRAYVSDKIFKAMVRMAAAVLRDFADRNPNLCTAPGPGP